MSEKIWADDESIVSEKKGVIDERLSLWKVSLVCTRFPPDEPCPIAIPPEKTVHVVAERMAQAIEAAESAYHAHLMAQAERAKRMPQPQQDLHRWKLFVRAEKAERLDTDEIVVARY